MRATTSHVTDAPARHSSPTAENWTTPALAKLSASSPQASRQGSARRSGGPSPARGGEWPRLQERMDHAGPRRGTAQGTSSVRGFLKVAPSLPGMSPAVFLSAGNRRSAPLAHDQTATGDPLQLPPDQVAGDVGTSLSWTLCRGELVNRRSRGRCRCWLPCLPPCTSWGSSRTPQGFPHEWPSSGPSPSAPCPGGGTGWSRRGAERGALQGRGPDGYPPCPLVR